mgnify:CR=1 FL=1
MANEKEIETKIISITNNIRTNYPELLEYLNEMTVTIPNENNPKINTAVLQSYYDSLCAILKKYKDEH